MQPNTCVYQPVHTLDSPRKYDNISTQTPTVSILSSFMDDIFAIMQILKAFPRLPHHVDSLASPRHCTTCTGSNYPCSYRKQAPALSISTSSFHHLLLPIGFFSPISLCGSIISITITVTCTSPVNSPLLFSPRLFKLYGKTIDYPPLSLLIILK